MGKKIFIGIIFIIIIAYYYYKTYIKKNTVLCEDGYGYTSSSKTECIKCNNNNTYIDSYGICQTCTGDTPYLNTDKKSCVNKCTNGYLYKDTCVPACPYGMYDNNGTCFFTCPNNMYVNNGTCVANCPTGTYNNNNTCVNSCIGSLSYIGNNNTCIASCTGLLPYNSNGTCVASCSGALPYNSNGTCVANCTGLLPYNNNGTCVASCTNDKKINGTTCVSNCTGLLSYNNNGTCVASCSGTLPYNSNGTCVANCSGSLYYNNDCVNSCWGSLPYKYNDTCVNKCKDNLPYNDNNICVSSCNNKLLNDNNCIDTCPGGKFLSNTSCVSSCVGDLPYINDSKCVAKCTGLLPYNMNGTCISTCTKNSPYNINGQCVNNCDSNMVVNGSNCYNTCPSNLYCLPVPTFLIDFEAYIPGTLYILPKGTVPNTVDVIGRFYSTSSVVNVSTTVNNTKISKCLYMYNNSSGYFYLPYSLTTVTEGAFCIWIMKPSTAVNDTNFTIFCNLKTDINNNIFSKILIDGNNNQLNYKYYTNSTTLSTSLENINNGILCDGNWHHIVISYNSTGVYAYYDGAFKMSSTNILPPDSRNSFSIGKNYAVTSNNSSLYFAEFRYYNKYLSSLDVYNVYNSSIY